jgi:hypothetical protein
VVVAAMPGVVCFAVSPARHEVEDGRIGGSLKDLHAEKATDMIHEPGAREEGRSHLLLHAVRNAKT